MSYKAAIVSAIESLKDNHTISLDAIKKHVQASLPPNTEWNHKLFLTSLKSAVEKGDLVQTKTCHKLSVEFKKKRAEEIKTVIEKKSTTTHVTPKRPMPVKEVPKKKPIVAKTKLNSPKVITVVKEGWKTEKMDLTPESEPAKPDSKEVPRRKSLTSKTKFVPRRLSSKTTIRNPMETR